MWWDILGCWRSQCEDEGSIRQRGGRQVCDSGNCTANVPIFDFIRGGGFLSNGRLGVSPKLPQYILPSVPCIFGSTLRCETIGVLCDLFLLNFFSCRILLTCRRVLGALQIDEYNIAGRHHRIFQKPITILFDDCASIGTSIVALRLPVMLVLGILVGLSSAAPLLQKPV